ncbi:MAG: hypothetical protein DWC07_01060 [Candidatus Poseidoniales archaeon]|nr:MAG: hypothetical protein DWC07_01060 [Candidatus Poseidoniales archaeon]
MAFLDFSIEGHKFHLGTDRVQQRQPGLNFVTPCMVAQVHDGMANMDARVLRIAIFKQSIQLSAYRGGGHVHMDSWNACKVDRFIQGLGHPNRARGCIG